MARLSLPIEQLKSHYSVIVIGSGYGGSITASRMARAVAPDNQKITVCVLERGKEFQPRDLDENGRVIKPGEYPDTEFEALRQVQVDTPQFHAGSRTGLYDIRMNKEINVFVGCGLGGTSLVNANVCAEAEEAVFRQQEWPKEIKEKDGLAELRAGYDHAREMLKPTKYEFKQQPEKFAPIAKLAALEKSAAHLQEPFDPLPINVNFDKLPDDTNHVGVEQHPCVGCGDCMTGCNYGAKNTVLMNYLPDARNHGAEIFTEISVRHIERKPDRWLVHYQLLSSGREKFDAPTMFVSADTVVLAAGTLGSTEILLRSKRTKDRPNGLPLSDELGKHFSGNGDVLGMGYNCDQEINGIGFGHRSREGREKVGPCITGIIDMRKRPDLNESVVIEDGSIAGPFANLLPAILAVAAKALGKDTDSGFEDGSDEQLREIDSLTFGPYRGALRNTQTMLVMAHDNAQGCLELKDDRLRISWPELGAQPIFTKIEAKLEEATAALGGTFVKNPLSNQFMGQLTTVHPLGGCIMADSAKTGVVNHKGQVFSGLDGTDVYKSLYVSDGSVIPRSLGINPLLTISAIAERCCALMAADRKWKIEYELPPRPRAVSATPELGIRFTENTKGYFSRNVTEGEADAYKLGAEKGRQEGSRFNLVVTIVSDDLDRTISEEGHVSSLLGSVDAPVLSAKPLTAGNGEFNYSSQVDGANKRVNILARILRLFGVGAHKTRTERRLHYRMTLRSVEGASYYFYGFKTIRDDSGPDSLSDATTLYFTLYEGENMKGRVIGKGLCLTPPASLLRQLTTLQVTNASGIAQRWDAMLRFGHLVAGRIVEHYGANLT